MATPHDDLRLLTLAETADLLRKSPSWLQGEVTAGRVAYTALGHRGIAFTRAQVVAIIADAERGPAVRLAEVHELRPLQVA